MTKLKFLLSLVNTTSVSEETHFELLWLWYVAYSTLVLASIFGNSVIIHIIRTDNSMKNATSYLILSQACVDLVIPIAEMMDIIHYSSMNQLWFGGLLGLITCKLCLIIVICPSVFSVWILATIAVERFYAVDLSDLLPSQNIGRKSFSFSWCRALLPLYPLLRKKTSK